jgi:hypothetical protein
MVVLATCDWVHVGLYSRMQDGRIVHLHEYWSCCSVGSLGDFGCKEGTYHGELQISGLALRDTTNGIGLL